MGDWSGGAAIPNPSQIGITHVSDMDAEGRAEPSPAHIGGRTDTAALVPSKLSCCSHGPPIWPLRLIAGDRNLRSFMSGSISARRALMEESDCPVNKKRRLMLRPRLKVDYSKSIRSQRPTFLSLPEDIMSRITSELTLKEAVQMSAICSKLRRAWIYHPNIDVGISTVSGSDISLVRGSNGKKNERPDQQRRKLSVKKFIDTVNSILRQHSGIAVNNLSIKFELRKERTNDINGWISFAIASKAKMVTLNFSSSLGSYADHYSFPCHLFSNHNASYLQVLRLYCVTFGPSPDFCGFPNLKTLSLERVLVLQNLQYFLLRCPALEQLSLRLCPQLHDLHASEPLVWLKFLCVQDCSITKIEFHAPNLTTFEYRGGSKVLIALHESLKLKKASIMFHVEDNLEYVFTELPNVLPHVETLHVEVFVKNQIHGFTHAPLKFIYLRHLMMKIIFSSAKHGKKAVLQLAYILEAAPFLLDLHLDMLCIDCCEDPPKGEVIVDRPHHDLKRACITGFNGNGGQVALAKYILRNAVKLEHMTVDPRGKIQNQLIGEFEGRILANEELVPEDKNGVLTIL
ncbi:hypothetical protein ACP70R_021809 [Stipagrostis hirtigluma subsp. patula]